MLVSSLSPTALHDFNLIDDIDSDDKDLLNHCDFEMKAPLLLIVRNLATSETKLLWTTNVANTVRDIQRFKVLGNL